MIVEPTSKTSLFLTLTPADAEDMIIELTKLLREHRRTGQRATHLKALPASFKYTDRAMQSSYPGAISLQVVSE